MSISIDEEKPPSIIEDDVNEMTMHVAGALEKIISDISENVEGKVNETTEKPTTEEIHPYNELSQFSFDDIPFQVTGAWEEFEIFDANYTRGCKWSPDGSCILTCSNDNILRVFNCPSELWEPVFDWENMKEMKSVLQIPEGECIFDFCWYPLMSSYDPATCCFISSSKNSTVHLWDAFTGKLRCTYRTYNHLDEIVTPHSLSFDTDGQKLYCGFNKMIRIFDISKPGREFEELATYHKRYGQSGIISCFAFSPWDRSIFAAGSFNKTIGIYSESDGELQFLLSKHIAGITHMCFSPDGTKLISGTRKDPEILCWDVRNLSDVLFSAHRMCLTNQRMYFDISRCGRYLVSGNANGIISTWDLTSSPKSDSNFKYPILTPVQFFQAHNDCVNGVSLHPTMPLLVSSSGQRKFPEPDSDEENSETFSYKSVKCDNSLRLWWASPNSS